MKVLVTGATGFVGGHLVDRLLERGDHVTALVRVLRGAPGLLAQMLGCISWRATSPIRLAIADAVHGQDVIIHTLRRNLADATKPR